MSCKGNSRLKVSKRSDKVSVLWNDKESMRTKEKSKKTGVPRYTIELCNKNRNVNESMVSFTKESARERNVIGQQAKELPECEGQQFMRIVVSSKNLAGNDMSNLQIEIINNRQPGGQASKLEAPHQQSCCLPETSAPASRYQIAKNGKTAADNPKSPNPILNESNYRSISGTRKKIFPLDNSKISASVIEKVVEGSNKPVFLPLENSLGESGNNRSFISMHYNKPKQPLGISRVSRQSNIESSKGPAAELSSFPMLQKKILDTSAHYSSVHVSSLQQPQTQPQKKSVGKENHSSSRKKIFVHPIKIKCSNGYVTSMKPPQLEGSYCLEAKVLTSVHSSEHEEYRSNTRRRFPILTDINEQPIMPGCCL